MFDGIVIFIRDFFIKFASLLPESPFNVEDPINAINDILGKINYFVPFYIFKDIFSVWLGVVFSGMIIYILFKFLRSFFE